MPSSSSPVSRRSRYDDPATSPAARAAHAELAESIDEARKFNAAAMARYETPLLEDAGVFAETPDVGDGGGASGGF